MQDPNTTIRFLWLHFNHFGSKERKKNEPCTLILIIIELDGFSFMFWEREGKPTFQKAVDFNLGLKKVHTYILDVVFLDIPLIKIYDKKRTNSTACFE